MTTTKKCWSCEETTPYEQGWCNTCFHELPFDIQLIVTEAETEPYAGAIRLVCAQMLKSLKYKPKPKLNLSDLQI